MLYSVVVMSETKLLTVKLDLRTLVEFGVAAKVFRARSVSSFLHNFIINQINLAKKEVGEVEFKKMVNKQMEDTLERSRIRADAAKKGVPVGTIKLKKQEEKKREAM